MMSDHGTTMDEYIYIYIYIYIYAYGKVCPDCKQLFFQTFSYHVRIFSISGDPNDKSIRRVEDVMIRKMMRDDSKIKCATLVDGKFFLLFNISALFNLILN